MSRYHFARAFAKAVGRSPLQYVIGRRMELARGDAEGAARAYR